MKEETIEIPCANCQTPLRVHQPMMIRADNGAFSQVALIPTWSLDERQCRNCGAINAPRFAPQIVYAWVAFEAPKEVEGSRILEPNERELATLRRLGLTKKGA